MHNTKGEIAKNAAAVIDPTEGENALRARAMRDNVRRLATNHETVRRAIVSADKNGTIVSRATVMGKIDIVGPFIGSRTRRKRCPRSK